MTHAEHFYVDGQAHDREPLHYRVCGLDNIFLLNGFDREVIDGEEHVTIHNLDGLWKAIGLHLVENRKLLSSKEIKFLRTHMDMTQAELAQILRVTDQTVARWEKGEVPLPGPADFALRTTFLVSPQAQPEGMDIVEEMISLIKELAATDDVEPAPMSFRHVDNSWNEDERQAA